MISSFRRNTLARILILALCIGMAAGCASRSKSKKKAAVQPAHEMIGTVVMVDPANRFVLIDCGAISLETGLALKSFSDGQESAVLAISPERQPPFIIADIVRGSPKKGDQVFK